MTFRLAIPKQWLFICVCLIITLYFAVHTVQGSRGYLRMRQVQAEILLAQEVASQMQVRKELLQAKVKALSPGSLDLDQLEESARRVLDMSYPDDIILETL